MRRGSIRMVPPVPSSMPGTSFAVALAFSPSNYYSQMIILYGNLLDCIYNMRRINEKRIKEWLNEDSR